MKILKFHTITYLSAQSSSQNQNFVNISKKGSLDENDVNNSRPVSLLNCFSKIFENIMKGQLIPFFKNHLSVFLSAYRSSYSSQHVLIRLMEEWRQNLDSDHIFRAVLMDLTKALHLIEFHMIFS